MQYELIASANVCVLFFKPLLIRVHFRILSIRSQRFFYLIILTQHLFNQILLVVLWMSVEVQSKSLMFQPLDCADIYNDSSWTSGVYMIYPAGPNSGRYVYCDMYTEGGKWTVSKSLLISPVGFVFTVYCVGY